MKYTAAHWGIYEIHGEDLKSVCDDPAPSRIGKGWLSASRNKNARILAPAVRKGWLNGDAGKDRDGDSYVEVSWERMGDLVTGELSRIKTTYGNEAIFAGSYGWASAGRFHHSQSQMKRFLNLFGGCIGKTETYSHAAAEVIMPYLLGLSQAEFQHQSTSWSCLVRDCQLLVSFGGMSGRTGQVNSSGISRHETENWISQMSARKVNVAPQQSDMSNAEWLSIRPGTDVALMLALCHTLLDNNWHAPDFLNACTSGWPQLRAYLEGEQDGIVKNAEWAAPLCDIEAEPIKALARDMAHNRTMINVSFSLQRGDHGEQAVWAGLALAAMLGQIGLPGGGFGFGYTGVGTVGRPTDVPTWPTLPQGHKPITRSIPVARVTDMLLNPGGRYGYKGQMHDYPDIKMIWWTGGNPFHHHQDLNRMAEAWSRPQTVIVCDHSWTATARRADLVLPSTTPLERHDLMMAKTDPALIYMSPVSSPMGAARDEYDMFTDFARRLGFEQAFTEGRDTEGWLRWLWQEAQKLGDARGLSMPDFERFREMGRFDLPDAAEERIALADFVKDPQARPLPTESGKITLFNETIARYQLPDCPGHPTWMQPVESLLDAPQGALHLLSAQPDTRLHSQNDAGSEAMASKVEGREVCYMHPQSAQERSISQGQIVRLYNERGATLAAVQLTQGIRPDCIALPTGAWLDIAIVDGERLEVHGNPNVLTIDKGTSALAQGNIAHTALVYVEPWTKPLPPITINRPPSIEPAR